MKKEISAKISWTTFIGNILILLHHANLETYYPEKITKISVAVMDFFSISAVPAMSWFFFISGYLFFRGFTPSQWGRKLKSRIFSLCIPYLIWNTLSVLLQVVKGASIFKDGALHFIRHNYIYCFGTGCANGPLWYIFRIITFLAIAPLIYCLIKKKRTAPLVILCIIGINILLHSNYFSFLYFLPIYMLGSYLGLNFSNELEKMLDTDSESKVSISCFITLIMLGLALSSAVIENDAFTLIVRYVLVIMVLLNIKYIRFPKPSSFIVGAGMYMYCAHDIVYRIMRNIITKLNLGMLASWMVLVVASFVLLIISWLILRRYIPKILNVLIGGRCK